jgi:EAL domain-containing protein (putative c-di-GMP-specific phosphodiesterase class I)
VDTLNEEDYLLTIETLLHDINENPLWIESITNWIHVDVTIGISIFQDDPITKANMALEFAQNHAKQFMVYNSMIDRTTDHKNVLYWKDAIRLALKSDNIVPYFQPIVDPDGKTIKYEALMRMLKLKNLGNIEVIAPASFLDIAMKINIYYELTQAMIDKSLRAISMTDKELSFNLTFDDILNNDTMIMLEDSIQKYNIGKRLIFEIVESQTIEDMEKLKSFTERFKRLGVRFAIDDFGTGYSNFSNILTIKPDYIKIDGSLIKDMNTNESSFVLSKAIVEFSHQLGMKVIAEYVHSETIFDLCKQIGVDQFQGYHFAEPLKEI